MGCLPPFSTGAGFRSHPPYGDLMDFHGIFHVSMSVSEGYPGLWRTSLQMASPWPQGNSCHYWCTVFPTRATTGHSWLVGGIPTPLKNDGVRQLGWSFPIYGKIKSVPNHQPAGHSWKCPMIFQPLQLRSHTKTHRTWIPPGIPTSPSLNSKGSWPDLHHTQPYPDRIIPKHREIYQQKWEAKTEGSSSHGE